MNLLLFSGGLDSTAIAYWLKPDRLLFLDYGQITAEGEMRAATQIANELSIPLDVKTANCRSFGAGDMVGTQPLSIAIPEFWPLRNQLLVTLAAMAYAQHERLKILIGTVASDSVHADGRPAFISCINSLLSCQSDARLDAPAISMTSIELVETSRVPASLLVWSFSCHRANVACGQCRGCTKHFETLGALKSYAAISGTTAT